MARFALVAIAICSITWWSAPRAWAEPPTDAAAGSTPETLAQIQSAEAETLERVDAVLEKVQSVRGLRAIEPVKEGVMAKEALRQLLIEKMEEDTNNADLEAEAKMLRRLGLLPRDLDYRQFLLDLLSEQIAGFYDDETKQLFLMEGQAPELLGAVLSHELFHAVQDQLFGIANVREGGDDNADLMMARVALIEGDAMAVMIDCELPTHQSFSEIPGFDTLMRGSMDMAGEIGGELLLSAPLVVRESLTFPYIDGVIFIGALKRHGGWPAVDAVYASPPSSTEQIIHPERYLTLDQPTLMAFSVPTAFTDRYQVVYDEVMGELGFYLFIKQHLLEHGGDRQGAAPASTGWDGDRTMLFEDPDGHSVFVQLSLWDSVADAREYEQAILAVSGLRFPDAVTRAFATGGALFATQGELALIERRGDEVLHVEGVLSDSWAAGGSLFALRDEVWSSRVLTPLGPFSAAVPTETHPQDAP